MGALFDQLFFLARNLKNELVRNYRNCDNREAGNWSGYLSESGQTHSDKSWLDFPSLRGKTNLKAKKKLFATSKRKPRIQNGPTTQNVTSIYNTSPRNRRTLKELHQACRHAACMHAAGALERNGKPACLARYVRAQTKHGSREQALHSSSR